MQQLKKLKEMESVKFIQCTQEELSLLVEKAVERVVSKLPKKRIQPFTKKETKTLFSCSYPTLMRWEQRGLLERTEVAGRVYYTVESVERLFAGKK